MRPPSDPRACHPCRAKQPLQKNRIKRGVFQQRLIVMRDTMHLARVGTRNCGAAVVGVGCGRGAKYFCKTVDTSKKRD